MSDRHGSEQRQRVYQVGVRLTTEEHAQLMAEVDRTGESPAELLRQAFFGRSS